MEDLTKTMKEMAAGPKAAPEPTVQFEDKPDQPEWTRSVVEALNENSVAVNVGAIAEPLKDNDKGEDMGVRSESSPATSLVHATGR